jgi:hypothetical protein
MSGSLVPRHAVSRDTDSPNTPSRGIPTPPTQTNPQDSSLPDSRLSILHDQPPPRIPTSNTRSVSKTTCETSSSTVKSAPFPHELFSFVNYVCEI